MLKKIIKINQQKNNKTFCETDFSRLINREKTGRQNSIPPFDNHGFYTSLLTMTKQTESFEQLIQNIHLVNDTFLYPASLISLLLFDNNMNPTQVLNADTIIHTRQYNIPELKRSIQDWDIYNKSGLTYHILHHNPEFRLYNFPDATGTYLNGFIRPVNNYSYILNESNNNKRFQSKEEGIVSFSTIDDYSLIQKELPVDASKSPICSAMLAPLIFDRKVLGILLIGLDIFYAYSLRDSTILKDENIVDFQQFIFTISTIIKKINSEKETNVQNYK